MQGIEAMGFFYDNRLWYKALKKKICKFTKWIFFCKNKNDVE